MVELVSEMAASGASGRAGFQGRDLDLDVQAVGRQGQGLRAGGLGGELLAVEAIRPAEGLGRGRRDGHSGTAREGGQIT